MKNTILTEDRVASHIHAIKHLLRMATHKMAAKKAATDYCVMTGNTVEKIIDKIENRRAESAIVIDDVGLQIINRLLQEGVKDIYLVLTRVPDAQFELVKCIINKTFPGIKINIIKLGDIFGMKVDLVISNPPYGPVGSVITNKIITTVEYKEFVNLEPGNDYFISDNYKYIDTRNRPEVLGAKAFEDANQTTVITKVLSTATGIQEKEARTYLHFTNDNEQVRDAIIEYSLSFKNGIDFSSGKYGTRRHSEVVYNENLFFMNSGAFDIIHGYLAVTTNGGDWSDATRHNVFKEGLTTKSDIPAGMVKGCNQFKKLIYSELGLKLIKVIFSSIPEGYGFHGGLFADIDYSDCVTWNDVFDKLNVSKASQDILIEAANKFSLNNKEKEICRIVSEAL